MRGAVPDLQAVLSATPELPSPVDLRCYESLPDLEAEQAPYSVVAECGICHTSIELVAVSTAEGIRQLGELLGHVVTLLCAVCGSRLQ